VRRRDRDQPVSDINITPLTDVTMVLLVIFMISSPILLARGTEVHLPQVTDPVALVEEDHVLYMSLDETLVLDGNPKTVSELPGAFAEMVSVADETGDVVNLFLRADESVPYGRITTVMDIATQAGIERISLVQDIFEPTDEPSNSNGTAPGE